MMDSKNDVLLTLAELHARGEEPFKADFLARTGKTIEEALEAFGHCTPSEFKRLVYLHTMPTDSDKVFTNPNLVQGAATIRAGKPGSVHEEVVRKSLETADKQRNFLSAALSVSGTPEVTPEWQRTGAPTQAHTPVPAPVVTPEPVAPAAPVEPAPAAAADDELQMLAEWCRGRSKSATRRMVTRSFTIEKEISQLVDIVSERLTESLGYEMGPAALIRRALRFGMAEVLRLEEERLKDAE